jgi:tetratricopeptide (TPR) repeat protein
MKSNPFPLQPITSLNSLTGRTRELNELNYYFGLTASGKSSHCAIIGPRGVGKSSLLLSSKEIANKHGLVPIHLDLNNEKVNSTISFWKDVYIVTCTTAAEVGAWGGSNSADYSEVVASLCGATKNSIFHLPRFWNSNNSQLACPDSLIKSDLLQIRDELRVHNHSGFLIFIDEADLLTIDISFLQSVRNVFQSLDGISVVLAGTTNLFGQVVEIFSPIPRQFHKIELSAFPHWSETQGLISTALGEDHQDYMPKHTTIRELHRLTGGAPAETQLYCHQMYKEIERGNSKRMELSTQVYKAVLQELRKFAAADGADAVGKLENLCKHFIPDCPWLQNSSLTATENGDLLIACKELELNKEMNADEKSNLRQKVNASYSELYHAGISSEPDILKINDGGCLKALWKSLVKLESDEEWEWKDAPAADLLIEFLHTDLATKSSTSSTMTNIEDDEYFRMIAETDIESLLSMKNLIHKMEKLSNEEQNLDEILKLLSMLPATIEALYVLSTASEEGKKNIVRIPVTIEKGTISQSLVYSFFDSNDPLEEAEQLKAFLDERKNILLKHGIETAIGKAKLYSTPSFKNLAEVIKTLGIRYPLNPSQEIRRGSAAFAKGNVDEAASIMQVVSEIVDTAYSLNNLAFCKIHQGNLEEAKQLLSGAIDKEPDSLFINNLATVEYLQGNTSQAVKTLQKAWKNLRDEDWKENVWYMNILNSNEVPIVTVWQDVPPAIGIGYSLVYLQKLSLETLKRSIRAKAPKELRQKFFEPSNIENWIPAKLASHKKQGALKTPPVS